MDANPPPAVSLREATRFWAKLGWINFGGPAGQIALMHEELVTRRRWIGEERFLHALNYCMLLPGPEAQQLAIYVGWLLHRARGGLLAGSLFVLPGALVMFLLAWIYAAGGHLEWVAAIFYGLRAGVVAIVAAALLRIAGRALRTPASAALALGAWLALFLFGVPFPLLIVAAGLVGAWLGRSPEAAGRPGGSEPLVTGAQTAVLADDAPLPEHAHPSPWRLARTLAIGLLAWWLPLLAVILWRGRADTASREAIFFSQAAVVTFGGAYAVLGYVQQAAVERFGWLLPGQMLDGLGLAETTPGPLILVLEFVGFLGGWRNPGDLPPLAAGALGAAVTLWATFAPCFLWIFAGAPYLERLRREPRLAGALQAITAAVVGVIANLALWFAIHALFRDVGTIAVFGHELPAPQWRSVDLVAVGLAAAAFTCIRRFRWNVIAIVAGCALAGWLATLAGWR
jgi:chromate transporter